MTDTETIKDKNNNIVAIIIYDRFQRQGTNFLTPGEFSQQLAFISRNKGETIPSHFHNPSKRDIYFTQETIFIKKGKIRINFYNSEKEYFDCRALEKGDVILLVSGGHGLEFMDDAELIEVKQGPYLQGDDKTIFKGIETS